MATGGQEINSTTTSLQIDVKDEPDYYSRLYKAILNQFVQFIPAVQFSECPTVSRLLSEEELERVQRKQSNEGGQAAARELITHLKRKTNWFDAVLVALDTPELKLQEFKGKILVLKSEVDTEWIKTHQLNPTGKANPRTIPSINNPLRAPVQTSHQPGTVPIPASGGDLPQNDFCLPVNESGIQLDADADEEKDPSSVGRRQRRSEKRSTGNEEYTDARSNSPSTDGTYSRPEPIAGDEAMYTKLSALSLEADAVPVPTHDSEVPQQETGAEAQLPERMPVPERSQVSRPDRQRRQRPQTRAEHPSLSQALSNNPLKDFEESFVQRELSVFLFWSDHQEEQEIIREMRSHLHEEGYYVIWYWALAKRPTVCVILNGTVTTFVVHKSSSKPHNYYFNRQQKRCYSLNELLRYHINEGIQYSQPSRGETFVRLGVRYE